MATQTYAQLRKKISALETQAAKLKTDEVADVVMRIKEAVAAYGLTKRDLFGEGPGVVKAKAKTKRAAQGKASASPKYVDGKGGQWVGRGKRPKWLSDALAAGRKLEDFLAGKFESAVAAFSSPPAEVAAPIERAAPTKAAKKLARATRTAKPARAARKAAAGSAKYSNGAGNSWTGMGPMPKWLKEAIANGKTRDDFLVKSA